MSLTVNSELTTVLKKAKLSFCWDEFTHNWHLDRRAYGSPWQSVMYLAKDQIEAEEEAVKHIQTYYLDRMDRSTRWDLLDLLKNDLL